MKWLVEEVYPQAVIIRVVLDNLSTHKPAALYERLSSRRSASDTQKTGVSLHTQAWQLVEYGRD